MLIITTDLKSSAEPERLTHALLEDGALQATGNTWLLRGAHSASSLMEKLEPLLPDQQTDSLLIAGLDAFAEIQWTNTLCGDAELGGLIRAEREG